MERVWLPLDVYSISSVSVSSPLNNKSMSDGRRSREVLGSTRVQQRSAYQAKRRYSLRNGEWFNHCVTKTKRRKGQTHLQLVSL